MKWIRMKRMRKQSVTPWGASAMVLALLLMWNPIHAQLDVAQGMTVEEYVNDVLLGEGVSAFNITYTGGLDQLGQLINGEIVRLADLGIGVGGKGVDTICLPSGLIAVIVATNNVEHVVDGKGCMVRRE